MQILNGYLAFDEFERGEGEVNKVREMWNNKK